MTPTEEEDSDEENESASRKKKKSKVSTRFHIPTLCLNDYYYSTFQRKKRWLRIILSSDLLRSTCAKTANAHSKAPVGWMLRKWRIYA
jgi:hypothetical protein